MRTATDTFIIGDYPELRMIAWNRQPTDAITGEEAFALYEANWRFVDQNRMLPHECAVVARLKREYGKGLMHV
jgi:hypothetical protein